MLTVWVFFVGQIVKGMLMREVLALHFTILKQD